MLESAGLRLAGFQATGSQAGDTGLDTGQGLKAVAVRNPVTTLVVITLVVIKTF